MSLSREILLKIQEQKKQNLDGPKKIVYFVGPEYSGSTSKLYKLKQIFGDTYHYITHEDFIPYVANETRLFLKYLLYLQCTWENLTNALKTITTKDHKTIFVDYHPILSVLNCEALYTLNRSDVITKEELDNIKKIYQDLIIYSKKYEIFKDFKQILYYINLPLESNIKLMRVKMQCEEITDNEKDELECVKDTIHSNIFELRNQFKGTEVIEVNTLMGLDVINMYLIGPSSC